VSELEALAAEVRAHRCEQEPCATCTGLVPGEGPAGAPVLFLGEAPGATEDEQGRPFVGRAGQLLDVAIGEAGLAREDVYVTNLVKARPPRNRDPKRPEVEHHLPWLRRELALVAPRLVVPLGRHALTHFAKDLKITQVRGTVVERDGLRLFPLLHPSAILRTPQLRPQFLEDARRLGDLARAE
jgi:uracil-DNA glycosylase